MKCISEDVYLLDVSSNKPVKAELRCPVVEENLSHWENDWSISLNTALVRLHGEGRPSQCGPMWDWREKANRISGLLGKNTFCIVCDGMTQGLMQVDLTKAARHPSQKGKQLVYVEYLESAPWNREKLHSPARYRGTGTVLIGAAINLSLSEEFKGRIGLHSLPLSEEFYRDKCGMIDLGTDRVSEGLRYFEMTPDQVASFIHKGRRS